MWRLHSHCACVLFDFAAGLTDFLFKLDERYNNKVKKDGTAMARKQRRLGCRSTSRPPDAAPKWTIDPEWKGLFFFLEMLMNSTVQITLANCNSLSLRSESTLLKNVLMLYYR